MNYQRTYNKYRFRPSRRVAFICFISGIFEKKDGSSKFCFIPKLKPFRKIVKSSSFYGVLQSLLKTKSLPISNNYL